MYIINTTFVNTQRISKKKIEYILLSVDIRVTDFHDRTLLKILIKRKCKILLHVAVGRWCMSLK